MMQLYSIQAIIFYNNNINNPFTISVKIDNRRFDMDVDTGASVSLINKQHYTEHFLMYKMHECRTQLFTYGNHPLKVISNLCSGFS